MEHWLKCNKCYRPAIHSSKEFFVTQCGHVFCSACVVEASKQCPECKSVGSQTILLQTPMPEQMCHYFTSVSSLAERAFNAARFQQNQFMISLRHARHIEEKYRKGKSFYEGVSKEIQKLSATRAKLREDIEKLRVAGAPSAAAPQNFSRSSTAHRENQSERTLACVSMSLKSQYRERRNVPDTSDSHCSQQIRHHREQQMSGALEYNQPSARPKSSVRVASQHRTITDSSNMSVPSISTQSRSSASHQEQHIERALEYNQLSARPRSDARVALQHRMLTDSSNMSVPSISTQTRSSASHQEQQIKRALEYNQPSARPKSSVRVAPQHRMLTDSSNMSVPSISTQSRSSASHQEQQIKRALEYNQPSARPKSSVRVAPQHRMLTDSSNMSVSTISTQSRSSASHQEQHIERALEYNQLSDRPRSNARVAPQHRMLTDSSNVSVPSIFTQSRPSANHREQQIKRALEYNQSSARPRSNARVAPQHRMLTDSSNVPVPSISTQSRPSANHREQQIKRALQYNQLSNLPRSSAGVAPQHRLITEASNIPVSSISSQSRPYTQHRESQDMRAVENTPMSVYQNHSNRQMTNYRYHQSSEENLCQYPPRTIISSARSSLDRTPQEEIHRAMINRGIPQSIETSSNTSHSGQSGGTFRNTPNSLVRFPNYNF